MKKVVGLGACVYDTVMECNAYPKEDSKLRAENIFVSGGGPVSNALAVMSNLGIHAQYLGVLAKDRSGDYLLQDFQRCKVDTDAVVRAGKRSFASYILLCRNMKTRTCVFDRGDIPDAPDLLDLSVIRGADILHLDGNYLACALRAAKYARENGIAVSLDAGGLYDRIDELLPYVDILIPSAEFAQGLTGKKDVSIAMQALQKRYVPKILVITDGKKGGLYWDGRPMPYESFGVEAVDTNGAGDTFHGAFLSRYLAGYEIQDCCRFASAAAAIKCTKRGVRNVISSVGEVEAFLQKPFQRV